MDPVPVVLEFVVFVSINTLTIKIIRSTYVFNFNPALYFFSIQELQVFSIQIVV